MKTILVIYTNTQVTKKSEISKFKKYAFLCSDKVKLGDLVDSPNYDTKMQIVAIIDTAYKYHNRVTGLLGNKLNSTQQYENRLLKVTTDADDLDIIHAVRVKKGK